VNGAGSGCRMPRGFDKSDLQKGLLLSLPFYEGIGSVYVQDIAKPHHVVSQTHAPVWTQLASGLWVLDFDGTNDYLVCLAAGSVDLDFTSQSFSMLQWVSYDVASDQVLFSKNDGSGQMGYYFVAVSSRLLQFRTVHAGTNEATTTGANVWSTGTWCLCGMSRVGTSVRIYVNGVYVPQTPGTHGDPSSSVTQDMYICHRNTQNTNGKVGMPRIWGRELSSAEHMEIFNRERDLFGV
jgi:hypothetical protein